MSKWWKEEPAFYFLGQDVYVADAEKKKGGKKEGKSASREAVIEAIQHW